MFIIVSVLFKDVFVNLGSFLNIFQCIKYFGYCYKIYCLEFGFGLSYLGVNIFLCLCVVFGN